MVVWRIGENYGFSNPFDFEMAHRLWPAAGNSDAFNPWYRDRSSLCIPDSKDAQVGSRSHALSPEISGMGPWTLCPGFVGGPELFSSVPSSLKNELL